MASESAWSFAALVGLGLGLTAVVGLSATSTTTTLLVDGCPSGSASERPDEAIVVDRAVRGGEPFTIPLPESARTGARMELRGADMGVAWAERPASAGWANVIGTCVGWESGSAPLSLGPFVAERDGDVRALLWPHAA